MADTSGSNLGDSDCDDSGVVPNFVVYTADQITVLGLRLVNFTVKRIKKSKRKTNVDRFKAHFGCTPVVAALIWEDLQTTEVEKAFLSPDVANLDHFLMAMHHLRKYPKEYEREAIFDISRAQGRNIVWPLLEKIQALKAEKIKWPADNFGGDIWVLTVDGTHCWIQEPGHPDWSQDSTYYSHKYGKAGVDYELGIALAENRLVWMNGPYPAGQSDSHVFKYHGLKTKLKDLKKMAIADGGYAGHPELLSTPNSQDSVAVRRFKRRALKRHETFNGMTKTFECLSGCFRNSQEKFAT